MHKFAPAMHPELFDVRDRLYQKFDISPQDADLAVRYVCCFLDAKRMDASKIIILPQIADWAWHELILDTATYRSLCMRTFGHVLSHVKEAESEILRDVFAKSMVMFLEKYGLEPEGNSEKWLDAGWDNPSYRLRNPIARDITFIRSSKLDLCVDCSPLSRLFDWLPARLVERFDIEKSEAEGAVRLYAAHLLALADDSRSGSLPPLGVLGRTAWEEHVLWVERYEADCHLVLGRTVDHKPNQATLIQ